MRSITITPRTCKSIEHLSSPKPGHTTGASRRGARRGGGTRSGRTVRQYNGAPIEQFFLALSKASKTRRLNVFPEAQTSEFQCKPIEKQNTRLNRCSSAVYHRDDKRSLFLAADQWNDAFCLCKPFLCSVCPRKSCLIFSPEERTSEILCKTMEEQNPWLTRGSSAINSRFIHGLSAGRNARFHLG